jgi:hypothetical protein
MTPEEIKEAAKRRRRLDDTNEVREQDAGDETVDE